MDRRRFLKTLGAAGAAAVLAGCRPLVTPQPTPSLAPTGAPTPTPLPTLTPSATPAYDALVATGRASSYDPTLLRTELARMLDGLGGLKGLVKPGSRVGIKTNLTGGTWNDIPGGPPPTEIFVTHPAVVSALGELLKDAGASKLYIVDGLGDVRNFDDWGYTAAAAPLGAEPIDLCLPAPYPDFITFPVGPKALIYQAFLLNPILNELDVFISVAKMKCHSTAGVTLSMKNLIGLAPINLYRRSDADNNRSAFHESTVFDKRLPRVVVDLNLARRVDLSIIDGIYTAEGGAGPWDTSLSQVKPGALLAGRDPVATDAAAATVMGFDPAAPSGSSPYLYGENHLALAAQAGLGTLDLNKIGISGPSLADLRYPFKLPALTGS
jgi:uncharacterized protein (DUF362 family)